MKKTVLITGTSSGFGQAAVPYFLERGWNVIATMRVPTGSTGPDLLVTRLDVQDRASIDAAIGQGIERFGRIDAVVNNAGYGLFGIFEGVTREAIQAQLDVNVFGVMDVVRAILPHFRANGAGTIVNVSSGAGAFGAPMASIYSASKFALEGFSEALSHELGAIGVRVKIVEPGGAPGTAFLARSGAEGAAVKVPAEYAPYVERTGKMYGGMAERSDRDAVAKVVAAIFEAVTDGTTRLRYAPTSDIQPLLRARRSTSDAEYETFVRGLFA